MSGGHDERVPKGEAEAVLDRPGRLEALDVDRRRTPRRDVLDIRAGRILRESRAELARRGDVVLLEHLDAHARRRSPTGDASWFRFLPDLLGVLVSGPLSRKVTRSGFGLGRRSLISFGSWLILGVPQPSDTSGPLDLDPLPDDVCPAQTLDSIRPQELGFP